MPRPAGSPWWEAYSALCRVAEDESETPERRRKAKAAVARAETSLHGGGSASHTIAPSGQHVRTTGGSYLHTEAGYDGWGS